MLAFVLTDLLKTGPGGMGNAQNSIGEIAGDKIDYNEFMIKVDERRELYATNDPTNVPDDASLREEAWNILINEKIIKREHKELGLVVSPDEFSDVTVGSSPHPRIIQAFQNPDTKQFDKNRFIQFLESDIQDDEDLRKRWLVFFEEPIKEEIVGAKYDKYVKSGVYTTKLDAQASLDENNEISAQVVEVPYVSISDSTIKVTDKDLKRYISANPDKFKQDASRAIQFVVINVFPSSKDSATVKKWAEDYVERFKNAKNDSSFVSIHRSQTPFNPDYLGRGSFEPSIEDQLFAADSGTVLGPFYFQGFYNLYKISDIGSDSVPSVRARHVYIPIMGSGDADTLEAMTKANDIMRKIRSGQSTFEEEAKSNLDGTGTKGGDLGYVREEGMTRMDEGLRKEIFKRSKGSMFVYKAEDGVHVVEITSERTTKTLQVAILNRMITPGNETDREAERLAAEIQYQAEQGNNFVEAVESKGLSVREADKVVEGSMIIPGIQSPAAVVRWLFEDETKEGTVSDVIDLGDRYVVAQCTRIREKGVAELDAVREMATMEYVKEQKYKQISEQMEKALSTAKNPEDLAKALNTVVKPIPAQTFNATDVMSVGVEMELLGVLFGMPEGKMSRPVKGNVGVYVAQVNGVIPQKVGPEIDSERMMISDQMKGGIDNKVLDALKKAGEIKDNRYKFF